MNESQIAINIHKIITFTPNTVSLKIPSELYRQSQIKTIFIITGPYLRILEMTTNLFLISMRVAIDQSYQSY